jgi:hypothetical protein
LIKRGLRLDTIIILRYILDTRLLVHLKITVASGRHIVSTDIAETSLWGYYSLGLPPIVTSHDPKTLVTWSLEYCTALHFTTVIHGRTYLR